jgi:hypothetical protein
MGIIHFSEEGVFSHKIKNIDNNINQMIEYFYVNNITQKNIKLSIRNI